MKKFLLSFLFFLFACASMWGAGPWTSGGTTVTLSGTSPNQTLTVTKNGNGEMKDYDMSDSAPWYSISRTDIKSVVIEEGVTHIGNYAFWSFTALQSVTVPSTLTSIGNSAFSGCTKTSAIHAYSPNTWASISFGNSTSTPFGPTKDASVTSRDFYFYGKDAAATDIAFSAGLTSISQYAFYHATSIEYFHIPGTVTSIGQYALDCGIKRIFINKKVAPSTGTTAISWQTGNETYLFLRDSATNSYNKNPWLDSNSSNTTGATKLCYASDHSNIKVACSWKDGRSLYKVKGNLGSIEWYLAENGTLTLNGTGTMPSTYNTTYNDKDVLPWFRLRQLVNKVVIKGGITDIGNALDKCWAIKEVSIEQNTIPSGTYGIYVNYKSASDTVKVYLKANASSISTAKSSSPWNNAKIRFGLNEAAQFSDGDETTLLSALKTLDLPFNLQINRSLNNTIYNTFCSPVAISAERMAEIWGEGTGLYEMSTSAGSGEENEVVMNFDDATEGIAAGVPYLIKPTNSNVTSFTIEGIAPSRVVSEPEEVSNTEITFYGTLAPRDVTEDEITNKSFIILTGTVTEDGQLLTYATGGTLGGMRAYWIMDTPAGAPMRRPVLRIGQSTTAFETVSDEQLALSGKKIMRNGQLFIVRGEKMYNMQGQLIK